MASIFTKIVQRTIPGHILAEDEDYIAFLDRFPLIVGHTLVIPKKEIDYLFDLEDATLAGLMVFAKKVAIALKKAIPCRRIELRVQGLEVPHAHIHLAPLHERGLNFEQAPLQVTDEDLAQVAAKIKAAL